VWNLGRYWIRSVNGNKFIEGVWLKVDYKLQFSKKQSNRPMWMTVE